MFKVREDLNTSIEKKNYEDSYALDCNLLNERNVYKRFIIVYTTCKYPSTLKKVLFN